MTLPLTFYLVLGAFLIGILSGGYGVYEITSANQEQAMKTQLVKVVHTAPEVITQTNTIYKVIHASKDACLNTALPADINRELRK